MSSSTPIEDQLRLYADAVDPATAEVAATKRRGPSLRATWLVAAAAVAVLLVGAALVQRDSVQQVETVPFVQEPEEPSLDDPATQEDPPAVTVQGRDPIYWPGGSTDPVATVEQFLDLSFPEWRNLNLLAVVDTPFETEPTSSSRTEVEFRYPDGQLFASVPLRFGDGRWFLQQITSPLLDLELVREQSGPSMEGRAISEAAGDLRIDLIYPFERTIEASLLVPIDASRLGTLIPITADEAHQEVHARLVSPSNELLAIIAFTAPASFPAEWLATESAAAQTPPLPDGVPATGDWRTREDSLAVMMAELALLDECMTARGFEFTMPTDQEWIELHGGWRPNGILGIGTEGAARLIGYQSDGWGGAGSPTQAAAWQTMTTAEQDAHYAALTSGPPFGAGPVTTGPPTESGRQVGGCWAFAESQLGDHQNKNLEFDRLLQFGSDGTQGERFRTDPVLAGAIADWQECIRGATGIDADTPNTLARQFAFSGASDSAREREIAVADVRCQQATNLEETFYQARTRQVRAELGDSVTVFDDYVRFRIETVALARQILTARGIVPPSLD